MFAIVCHSVAEKVAKTGEDDDDEPPVNSSTPPSEVDEPHAEHDTDAMGDAHGGASAIHDVNLMTPPSVMNAPDGLQEWLNTFHNWSHVERLYALEQLVTSEICDIQQIRFLLALIEPQLQRDFISLLPKELALYVLSFLEPKDLLRAAQTCRYWRVLCEDNLLWREKCREEGLLDDHETIADLFRRRVHNKRCPSPSLSQSGPSAGAASTSTSHNATAATTFTPSEYKRGYLRQKQIECNWRYGRFPNSEGETSEPVAGSSRGRYLKEILQLKGWS